MRMKSILLAAGLLAGGAMLSASAADLTHWVNPFIGTVPGSGNTYPGAQAPFGMISWSPHTLKGSAVGYNFNNDQLTGFGLLHQSGVGCDVTCDLPFMPCTGDLAKSPVTQPEAYYSRYAHTDESASPGYYAVKLATPNIDFETAVQTRSGIARITFPAGVSGSIILNPNGNKHGVRDGHLEIDSKNRLLRGWVKSGEFCQSKENDYTIYFTARFDQPFQAFGTWEGASKNPGATIVSGTRLASYLTFDTTSQRPVTMKVGISFVSMENAQLNLDTEIPGWNFAAVKTAVQKAWNEQLGRIEVAGGDPTQTTIFYTAVYHSLLLPSIFEDVNGQYRGMDDAVHTLPKGRHFLSTFSGWDTYRTQAQLWGLMWPDMASDFCMSMLAMSQQTKFKGGGGFPLWSLLNDETIIMNGYPADPYIASAYAFGATNMDIVALKNVMVDSGKNQRWCGRVRNVTWDGLPSYMAVGYCAEGEMHSACSLNVEYAVADFAIAQVCRATGDEANYAYFLDRSQSVFKLINPETKYLQRRNKDGSWVGPFDRFSGGGFTEGNSAHYTWGVPHNLARLVREIGGQAEAEARLDELTSQLATGYAYTSKHYEAGNEPCFGIVPVYNWLQKPWKAQDRMRMIMASCFQNNPAGIPGDDDSGAMSAWYLFGALGLYPEIQGIGGFTVLSPLFPEATLHLPNGHDLKIAAKKTSPTAKYVQALRLNGQPSSQLWLTVDQLTQKRTTRLDFDLGPAPHPTWGTAAADAPPSFDAK